MKVLQQTAQKVVGNKSDVYHKSLLQQTCHTTPERNRGIKQLGVQNMNVRTELGA